MKTSFHATRFAPSPTGPMHFGSLVCALASYLIAKQSNAKWLIRVEDVDRARCKDTFATDILDTLCQHGLVSDEPVIYQSGRDHVYHQYLQTLANKHLLYGCLCSRREYKDRGEIYDGFCRGAHHALEKNVVRLKNDDCPDSFVDLHFGATLSVTNVMHEDPVLQRADGQFTYNHAVVVDDIEQHIDLIVRGADLLDQTPLHLNIFRLFGHHPPAFLHIPTAVHKLGIKYSKQAHSPAIKSAHAINNLKSGLQFLGMQADKLPDFMNVQALLEWAIINWHPNQMPHCKEIVVTTTNDVYSVHYDHNSP